MTTEFGKPISLRQFCKAHADDYLETGIYHIGEGRWLPRCPAGVLLASNGTPYARLDDALADLASIGIRRIAIEWDGLPSSDRAAKERAALAKAH